MSLRRGPLIVAVLLLLTGCARSFPADGTRVWPGDNSAPVITAPLPIPRAKALPVSWDAPQVTRYAPSVAPIGAQAQGPYRLDTGDRLRIFVYGQPNLSRIYPIDQSGLITMPLIGRIKARGRTTRALEATIRRRLGARYVKDPQVNVDMAQNRPFFILGEVRSPGQYPYVSGITVQAAVAIAGGYSERADEQRIEITRRSNGHIEKFEVRDDFIVRPGDTLKIRERFF